MIFRIAGNLRTFKVYKIFIVTLATNSKSMLKVEKATTTSV